jgi:sugar lactone lactonase YvrE
MPRVHLIPFLILAGCLSQGGGGDGKAPPFTNGVSTLAGAAEAGYVDGSRDVARFHNPVNVAYGPDGKLYVADFDNSKIRAVADDGTTTTIVAQQGFAKPFGIAFAGSTLWVTTDNNSNGAHAPGKTGSVWRVDISAKTATEVADSIGMPRGIAPLKDGRIALTDYENHIVEIMTTDGAVTTIAGTRGAPGFADGCGAAARFSQPYAVVQRSDGSLVVTDYGNHRLRAITLAGCVTTLAGTGQSGFADGAMTGAMFDFPEGLAIASNDDLYITDTNNFRVRHIKGTNIETIAGDGMAGYVDDDDRLASELYGLEGISVKPDGSMVYVADGTRGDDGVPYNRVRQIKMQ